MHPSGQKFAGSASCSACHGEIVERHMQTPHFLTSQIADTSTVEGSFEPGHNVVELNDWLRIVMEKTEEGLFQRGVSGDSTIDRKPFDLTIGSGRQGQTYLVSTSRVVLCTRFGVDEQSGVSAGPDRFQSPRYCAMPGMSQYILQDGQGSCSDRNV